MGKAKKKEQAARSASPQAILAQAIREAEQAQAEISQAILSAEQASQAQPQEQAQAAPQAILSAGEASAQPQAPQAQQSAPEAPQAAPSPKAPKRMSGRDEAFAEFGPLMASARKISAPSSPKAPAPGAIRIGWEFPFIGRPQAPAKGKRAARSALLPSGEAKAPRAGYSRLPWDGALPKGASIRYLGGANAPWLPAQAIGRIMGWEQTSKSRRYEISFSLPGADGKVASRRTNLAAQACEAIA